MCKYVPMANHRDKQSWFGLFVIAHERFVMRVKQVECSVLMSAGIIYERFEVTFNRFV